MHTWAINNHSLKMGADFVRNVGQYGFAAARGNPPGTMTYRSSGAVTNPFAHFLLGLAPSRVTYIAQPRPPMDVHNWEQGYFFQDDWKITPRLTVNLGVRYELVSPFVDKNAIRLNSDPSLGTNTER